MAIATGTALAIASIAASSAGSVYAASKTSSAAKSAAATQAQSGNDALALQREMYQQTRADLAPYANVGSQAVTALGSLMGLGGGGGTAASSPSLGTMVPGYRTEQSLTGKLAPTSAAESVENGRPRREPARTLAEEARTLSSVAGNAPAATAATTQPANATGYVQMKAPTGEVQAVPNSLVSHYTSLGATLVQ